MNFLQGCVGDQISFVVGRTMPWGWQKPRSTGSIRPVNDRPDQGDVWQVNVKSGDCEDFALTKRDHLIAMGWSPRALRIAVTKTPYGEGHAVLVVKTDQGDLVLDNRTNAIKGWKDTDLRWLMIQSGDNPRVWYEL